MTSTLLSEAIAGPTTSEIGTLGALLSEAEAGAAVSKLGDLVTGDRLIEYIFGHQPDRDSLKRARRKLYHLATGTPAAHRPPIFRLGPRCFAARRSRLV